MKKGKKKLNLGEKQRNTERGGSKLDLPNKSYCEASPLPKHWLFCIVTIMTEVAKQRHKRAPSSPLSSHHFRATHLLQKQRANEGKALRNGEEMSPRGVVMVRSSLVSTNPMKRVWGIRFNFRVCTLTGLPCNRIKPFMFETHFLWVQEALCRLKHWLKYWHTNKSNRFRL